MQPRSWSLTLVFAVLLWGLPELCRVSAQAESSAYRELVEQALGEYGNKNYEEASTLFARAHKLNPNARTLRGMGMAAFELRQYPESIGLLEAALASNERALDPPLRKETEALLQRARGFVATVTVDVQPRNAELLLDGNRVDAYTPLSLSLGEHVFELRQSGHVRERRVVRLRGGEVLSLRLALLLDGVEAEADARPDAAPHEARKPLYKSAWLWTGVGVVVAGAITASVLLATRGEDKTVTTPIGTANTPPGISLTTIGVRP